MGFDCIKHHFGYRGIWKNLNKQIKLYSIDEIVVHHASPILYLFAWGLKLKNSYLKIVAYAHCEAEDMLSGSGKLSIKDKIIVHSFANSDKVIAISSAVRSSLIECFGLQENKICVVYNGVDLSRFKPNYNCEMHNPIRLLYVGRLVKEKGVQNILFALSKLSEKSDNWSFDIVGAGEYRNNFNCVQSNPDVGCSMELFGKDSRAKKIISYAASFGNTGIKELKRFDVQDEIAELLKKFTAISVRDKNSEVIVKELVGKMG